MTTFSDACLVFVNVQTTFSPASMSRSSVAWRAAGRVVVDVAGAGAHQAGQRPAG